MKTYFTLLVELGGQLGRWQEGLEERRVGNLVRLKKLETESDQFIHSIKVRCTSRVQACARDQPSGCHGNVRLHVQEAKTSQVFGVLMSQVSHIGGVTF